MKIEVEVKEEWLTAMVQQRVAELFCDDARYRDSTARESIRRIIDGAATEAVSKARDSIAAKLPEMAAVAVEKAIQGEIGKAATRGISALKKLYAGFDPNKLTADQRAWLERQISEAAKKEQP